MKHQIGLVTCDRFPSLHVDDLPLKQELENRGFEIVPIVWDSARELPKNLILRTPWDYAGKYPTFLKFIEKAEYEGCALWNPPEILRWNLHKRYLLELAKGKIPILPTVLCPVDYLPKVLKEFESERPKAWPSEGGLVVKPAVGAGGYENQFLRMENGSLANQCDLTKFTGTEVLIQPYWPSVKSGERSMMYFAGVFSHAVLKTPATGEYRTQEQHGAHIQAYAPTPIEREFGVRVLNGIPGRWLYARIDYLVDENGQPALMELEMVEPSLFFQTDPTAPARFAEAIATTVRHGAHTRPDIG